MNYYFRELWYVIAINLTFNAATFSKTIDIVEASIAQQKDNKNGAYANILHKPRIDE